MKGTWQNIQDQFNSIKLTFVPLAADQQTVLFHQKLFNFLSRTHTDRQTHVLRYIYGWAKILMPF